MSGLVKDTPGTANPGGEDKTPAGGTPPPAETPKPEAKQPPPAAAGGASQSQQGGTNTPPNEPAKKTHRLADDDDDIPSDADLIEMSPRALKQRLARGTKKELRARFGTDDLDDIKTKLDRLSELENKEEERRRADLSEQEKLKEDLAKERTAREAAESRLADRERAQNIDHQDQRLRDLASDHIKPKFWRHVSVDFAEHLLKTYSARELEKIGSDQGKMKKMVNEWFGTYLEENPEYRAKPEKTAEDKDTGKDKDSGKKVTVRKVSNGANTNGRPNPTSTGTEEKTFAPNRPNSMSKNEAREEMKKMGVRY